MTRHGRRCLAVLLALSGVGCDRLLTHPVPYGTVRVTALTRDGIVLPGIAAVLYTGARPMAYATTDSAGAILWRLVPEGEYGVFLTLPDAYATIESLAGIPRGDVIDRVRVTASTDTTLRFTLLRKGAGQVVAQVLRADGSPLSDILVTLFSSSGVRDAQRSDVTGRATFRDVPFGSYGVFVDQSASSPGTAGVRIVQDGLLVDLAHTTTAVLRFRP